MGFSKILRWLSRFLNLKICFSKVLSFLLQKVKKLSNFIVTPLFCQFQLLFSHKIKFCEGIWKFVCLATMFSWLLWGFLDCRTPHYFFKPPLYYLAFIELNSIGANC